MSLDDALVPRLTPLDRRVLARVPSAAAEPVLALATFRAPDLGPCPTDFRQYGKGADAGCRVCQKVLDKIAGAYEEHCEILRGLEAVGLVVCIDGKWRQA